MRKLVKNVIFFNIEENFNKEIEVLKKKNRVKSEKFKESNVNHT